MKHLIFNEQYLVTLVFVNEDSLRAKARSIVRLLQHKIKQSKNGGVRTAGVVTRVREKVTPVIGGGGRALPPHHM
jgi:hypothetical protein